MKAYDWQGLRARLLAGGIPLLRDWFPNGVVRGGRFHIGDISGVKGDSLSVRIADGFWHDWATGQGGDLIDLYALSRGISVGEAARALDAGELPERAVRVSAPKEPPKPLETPPEDAPEPSLHHYRHGEPARFWVVRSGAGAVLHYVARYEPAGERKQIVPWTWADGKWQTKGPPTPRPLYGLDRLAALPDAGVLIVEGEKCADAACDLFRGAYAVVTWTGGSGAVHLADWSPVHGRRVLIWPDADDAGIGAANRLAGMLVANCQTVSVVDVTGMPDGWDVADAEFADRSEALAWLRDRVKPYVSAEIVQIGEPEEVAPQRPAGPRKFASVSDAIQSLNLHRTERNVPYTNLSNAAIVLREHPETRGRLWFDAFAHRLMIETGPFTSEPVEDQLVRKWTEWMQTDIGLTRISSMTVHEAAAMVCMERSINPVSDYLRALEWDHVPRIDRFFADFGGCDLDAYHIGVARTFWLSMVARALRPGCEVHQMVVAYGAQGIGKTSMFKIVADPWFATSTEPVESKDFFLSLRGALITEIGELDSFSKAEIGRVKLIITGNADKYREPYARVTTETPRAGILVGTTNERNFLHDHSGGRRFLPVAIEERIDLEFLRASRDQLFAEAVTRFDDGEPWFSEIEGAAERQEAARIADPWESIVREALVGRMTTTATEVLKLLDVDPKDQSKAQVARVLRVLHALRWVAADDGVTWERPL